MKSSGSSVILWGGGEFIWHFCLNRSLTDGCCYIACSPFLSFIYPYSDGLFQHHGIGCKLPWISLRSIWETSNKQMVCLPGSPELSLFMEHGRFIFKRFQMQTDSAISKNFWNPHLCTKFLMVHADLGNKKLIFCLFKYYKPRESIWTNKNIYMYHLVLRFKTGYLRKTLFNQYNKIKITEWWGKRQS